MQQIIGILAGCFIIAGLLIAGAMDADAAKVQADTYCEMVSLWKQTEGRQGWPDYNGTYAVQCE